MSRDDLFAQAFGGKEAPEVAAKGGKGTPPDARTELFKQAFPVRKEPDLQAPLLGTSFRFNMSRVAKLSFDEQMSLQKYEGASIRDLPAWLIDGGYVVASEDEKKYQKQMFKETGFTQSERNEIFDAHLADIQALAAMAGSEILRDSEVLDSEFVRMSNKYGAENVLDSLADLEPQAAGYLNARLAVKAAETQAIQAAEMAQANKSVEQEIAEAKEAIEAMNADQDNADEQSNV